jgi:hypothetical protein
VSTLTLNFYGQILVIADILLEVLDIDMNGQTDGLDIVILLLLICLSLILARTDNGQEYDEMQKKARMDGQMDLTLPFCC